MFLGLYMDFSSCLRMGSRDGEFFCLLAGVYDFVFSFCLLSWWLLKSFLIPPWQSICTTITIKIPQLTPHNLMIQQRKDPHRVEQARAPHVPM